MKLQQKVAVVTGGGGFIGRAIAARLGREGAAVVLIDANRDASDAACAQLAEAGIKAAAYTCDITNPAAAKETIQQITEQCGEIDVFVNCAGGGARGEMRPFHEQSMEVIDAILQVNLMGTINCLHAVVPHMVERRRGKIINIASIVGEHGLKKYSEYAAAKAGVLALTKSLAMELGQYDINVNAVSPGIVSREPIADEVAFARRTNWLNRACTGEDIAHAACFLATSEADFVTGQNYIVDGGRSLGLKGS